MRKKRLIDVRSYILLFLIVFLALLMLYFLRQLQAVDLLIMKSQRNEQASVEKLESRVKTLEDVVIMQGKIIMGLEELQPSPEISKTAPDPKKTSYKVETFVDPVPITIIGAMQMLRALMNPVKRMLSY